MTDCVLRLDNDDCRWFESLSGATCPPELIAVGTVTSPWQLIWTVPDAAGHRDRARATSLHRHAFRQGGAPVRRRDRSGQPGPCGAPERDNDARGSADDWPTEQAGLHEAAPRVAGRDIG